MVLQSIREKVTSFGKDRESNSETTKPQEHMKYIYGFKLADVTLHLDIRPIYQDHNALVCMKIQPRHPQTVSMLNRNYSNWAKKINKKMTKPS